MSLSLVIVITVFFTPEIDSEKVRLVQLVEYSMLRNVGVGKIHNTQW